MTDCRVCRDHGEDNMDLNEISGIIIGAAITVPRELGPGLLETNCKTCLDYELAEGGVKVGRQKALPLKNRGVHIDYGYRSDLLVEHMVVVEPKVMDSLQPIYESQVFPYLKFSSRPLGLLNNVNVTQTERPLR